MKLTTATLAAGTVLAASTNASAGLIGLHLEQHAVDAWALGTTTWRLYAEFDNPTDQLNNVGGHILNGGIGFVVANGGVRQDPFGGAMSSDLNAALFGLFPQLEFDTMVTIGGHHNADSQTLSTVGGITWNLFEPNPGNNAIGGPLIAFWGWWTRPVNDQYAYGVPLTGLPNYHVLVGQFTIDGYGPTSQPWGRLSLNGQMEQILFNGEPELVPWEAHGVEFGTPHDLAGACCFEDDAYGSGCVVVPEDQCDDLEGNWFGEGTGCADPIVECDTIGACCHEDADGVSVCKELYKVDCDSIDGLWYGAATTCGDPGVNCDDVPELGACCYVNADGVQICEDLSPEDCLSLDGDSYGSIPCTDPVVECGDGDPLQGACCYQTDDGGEECVVMKEEECDLVGGTWFGGGIACSDPVAECGPETNVGACCIDDGSGWFCADLSEANCTASGGVWYGVGTFCSDPGFSCGPVSCHADEGSDCAGRPQFLDQDFQSFGHSRVAVQTVSPVMPGDRVVTVFDLEDIIGAPYDAAFPIDRYSDPSWRPETLGGILGLAIDEDGNIFVSASETWTNDQEGIALSMGAIYKIDTYSGAVSIFAILDVDNTSLGSITYDCEHDQFFVSNFNDGRIYRLDHASGVTLDTFDHGTAWNNLPGPAPLGERVFGLEVNGGRLYYALWNEDIANPSSAAHNEIWSVALSAAGIPIIGTEVMEIEVSDYSGQTFSSPVADIDFSSNKRMYLAERSQYGIDMLMAHQSRALEYECMGGIWTRTANHYQVGEVGVVNDSAAGGIDAKDEFVWASGDALHLSGGAGDYIYGFQGIPIGGGTTNTSLLIDYNNNLITGDKTQLGDLVVTRVPGPPPSAICPEPQLLAADCLDADHTAPFDFDLVFGVNNNDPSATLVSVTMTPPAGMSVSPPTVAMSVAPLHAWPFGTVLSGATSGGELCIDLEYHFNNGVVCSNQLCINLPLCEIWIRGDVNYDGTINIDDLMLLIGSWGTICDGLDEDCNWMDADESGVIDMGDLLVTLGNWTL